MHTRCTHHFAENKFAEMQIKRNVILWDWPNWEPCADHRRVRSFKTTACQRHSPLPMNWDMCK